MIIILYNKVKNLKESNEKLISDVRKNKFNIDKHLENSSQLLSWREGFDHMIELNWVERKVIIKSDLEVSQNLRVTGDITANRDIHTKNDLHVNHNLNVNNNL